MVQGSGTLGYPYCLRNPLGGVCQISCEMQSYSCLTLSLCLAVSIADTVSATCSEHGLVRYHVTCRIPCWSAVTVVLSSDLCIQGARIGKNAYLDCLDFSDFDLINIGDDAAINKGATLLGHYFNDRHLHFGEVLLLLVQIGKWLTLDGFASCKMSIVRLDIAPAGARTADSEFGFGFGQEEDASNLPVTALSGRVL